MAEGLAVKIEGLSKLRRELKKASDEFPKELKKVSLEAGELVAVEMRGRAPHLTGTMQGTIKAHATNAGAYVKVGPLVYLKPIVFGWARHNISPNPFPYQALDARRAEVIATFQRGLDELMARNFTPGMGD